MHSATLTEGESCQTTATSSKAYEYRLGIIEVLRFMHLAGKPNGTTRHRRKRRTA